MKNLINISIIILITMLLWGCNQPPDADLIITNARIITVTGEVIENGSILIKGNNIHAVTEEVYDPSDSSYIDAAGRTVMPGITDTHTHLTIGAFSQIPENDRELDSVLDHRIPSLFQAYLDAGITSVISTGELWPAIKKIKERVESGELAGPRIFTSGPVFTAPGGHPATGPVCGDNSFCAEHIAAVVDNTRQVEDEISILAENGVDLIKMVYDSLYPPGVNQLKSEVANAIIQNTHKNDLRAFAHVINIKDAIYLIENNLDGLVHLPNHSTAENQLEELIKVMRTRGVTASTTIVVAEEIFNQYESELTKNQLERQKQVLRIFVQNIPELLVLGTDTPWLTPFEAFHREVQFLLEANMTPEQVIRTITINAARHAGREQIAGSLDKGKLADLIILDGNPLEDLSALKKVDMVIKNGKVVVEK